MTVTADAQKAASAVAKAPQDVVVAAIQTLQNAMDGAKNVVVSGVTDVEGTADHLLENLKRTVPGLDGPWFGRSLVWTARSLSCSTWL